MDIVDVDEALKDDSFIFLEDKTHDDISNILQQWKSSNCIPPSNNTTQQPQQQQQEQAYKYDSRTFTRPKRKTAQNLELQFTNTPHQSQLNNQHQHNVIHMQSDNPILNVEIGGLVTNMHKSFLQDTSPPPFSSMDASMDRMNNSLITSADFTNINFLQSTNSLDFGAPDALGFGNFNLTGKVTSDGYSLSDMIRDRKALESLTMSSDGTLIKDSHIGQIDDISLMLSKTASGCSTMDNSTESVEINNRTMEIINSNMNRTLDGGVQLELAASHGFNTSGNNIDAIDLQRTMVLSNEMIGDITYNLVENSMHASIPSDQALSVTQIVGPTEKSANEILSKPTSVLDETVCLMIGDITYNLVENSMHDSIPSDQALSVTQNFGQTENSANEILSKPTSVLEETVCLSAGSGGDSCLSNVKTGNSTFDCENVTPDLRCETPENEEKKLPTMKCYESTPHASSVRYNKHHYTPKLKMIHDGSISPIVAIQNNAPDNATRILNETFENSQRKLNKTSNINTNTFSGKLPLMTTVEMIENIENPAFDKSFKSFEQQSPASLEMKNVMDLAEAEANLLASNNNEEEFDNMLDEFSKVELNAEQLKMKKSLDSIKRRFNYGQNRDKSQQREISREAKDMRDMIRGSADILGDSDDNSKDYLNMTMDIAAQHADVLKNSKEHLVESPQPLSETSSEVIRTPLKDSVTTSSITGSKLSNGLSLSSASTTSNGGERLLSRRSRLYDDFNASVLSSSSIHGTKISLGSSFTVQSEDDVIGEVRPNITSETENLSDQNHLKMVQEKTEATSEELSPSQISDNSKEQTPIGQYKLAEKRERDRDRFKTIKINRNRNADAGCGDGFSGSELNVPCIDDYPLDANVELLGDAEQLGQRFSRRDQATSPVFNNNKSEVEAKIANKTTSKLNQNFLTYKKPKDKPQSNVRNLTEIAPATTTNNVAPEVASFKPRSLSRPRYLSGLTKFSAVCKATSADELEKTTPRLSSLNTTTSALNVGLSKGSSAANVSLNRTQKVAPSEKQSGELKSPMGTKSKSFHNLSSHHTYAANITNAVGGAGGSLALKSFGLKKPNAAISFEKLAKANPNRNSCLSNSSSNQQQITQQKSDESVFKVPKLVSGIRAPGAAIQGNIATKRAGLVRPSSGYYSLTVAAKGVHLANSDADCDAGRHSPTDSMSSASSRGSAQSFTKTAVSSTSTGVSNNSTTVNANTTAALTKITIGSTGIPKPSGLRPPSNLKRSGLPRPSSFIKTDK